MQVATPPGPCRFLETRLREGARSCPRHVQCTWGARRRKTAESCRLPPQGRVDRCYRGDTTVQVATPPTASEFRGGIIGVTLRLVSGADFVSPITDEHLPQQEHIMAPCNFAYSLSELTVCRAPQKHEVLNHSNCDYSTAHCRSSLQRHRTSIFCIVIPQSIVHGVLPRAHINDCEWHNPAQTGAIFSFLVC